MNGDDDKTTTMASAATPVVTHATVSPLAAVASRPLPDAVSPAPDDEPVPDRLVQLARELDEALAARRYSRPAPAVEAADAAAEPSHEPALGG